MRTEGKPADTAVFNRARGSYRYDEDGHTHLDFFARAGSPNHGHNQPYRPAGRASPVACGRGRQLQGIGDGLRAPHGTHRLIWRIPPTTEAVRNAATGPLAVSRLAAN